jgi:hypothetical protein
MILARASFVSLTCSTESIEKKDVNSFPLISRRLNSFAFSMKAICRAV